MFLNTNFELKNIIFMGFTAIKMSFETINGTQLQQGIYFYRLIKNSEVTYSGKLIIN